ncbi:MAG TPA: putative Ig domain-containing protein, partial [bacterium]|nr:putative Ig domain-containing protein [bacterium]
PTNVIGFGLALDPATGVVSGVPTPDAPALITFVARVIDSCGQAEGQRAGSQVTILPGGRFDQAAFVIPTNAAQPVCDAPGPQITTTALPGGTVDAPYSFQLEATGGDGALTWTADGLAGSGLTLSTSGLIGGAPLTPGPLAVTVTVTDSCESPQTDTETFTIDVACSGVAPSFGGTTTLPDAFIGSAYDQTIPVTFPNGAGSVQVVAGSLPTGLQVSTQSTGARTVDVRITGTPTNPAQVDQTFNFTLRATDACPTGPLTTDRGFTLTLRDQPVDCPEAPPQITTTTLPQGVAGEAYSATIDVVGGTPPVGPITIVDENVPGDLSIGADGRTLEGTLPAGSQGSYQVTLRVEDACETPRADQVTLTLEVISGCVPIQITTTDLPNATNGQAYNATIEAIGGTGARTFSILSGRLPNDLLLNADGTITGTTNDAPGDYTFDVQVADSCPDTPGTDTATLTITVVDEPGCTPVDITTETLPDPTFGTEYLARVETSGGQPPLTFALTAGDLPSGLTLDAGTGDIVGTPDDESQVGREFTFDVTVTDSCTPVPTSDTATFTVTLQPLEQCTPVQITTSETCRR